MGWLYRKENIRDEHFNIYVFGGAVHANMSTNCNPGTWFIYFGEWLRITTNRPTDCGFALLFRSGWLHYQFLMYSGQVRWTFPWKKFAVK